VDAPDADALPRAADLDLDVTVLSDGQFVPGMPRQTGQTWVLGGAPNSVEQPQKILVRVLSWA
jgi:hypothetical protein